MNTTLLPVRDDYWVCTTRPNVTPWYMVGQPFSRVSFPSPYAFNGQTVFWIEDHALCCRTLPQDDEIHVPLPDVVQKVVSMAATEDAIFLGCIAHDNTARLLVTDARRPGMFRPVLPNHSPGIPNQPITCLTLHNHHLYAIDTAHAPKILIGLDITQPLAPIETHRVRIPSGVDDHPQHMAFGRTFMALLTTTSHPAAKAWKVGIYEQNRFDEISTFFHRVPWEQPFEAPLNLFAHEDLLLFGQGSLGVGACRLDDGRPPFANAVPKVQPWSRPYLGIELIRYTKPLEAGRVTRIVDLLADKSILCEVQHGSRRWWENIPGLD